MPLTSNCCSAAFPLRERGLLAPCGNRTNENQMRESGKSRQSTREEATKLRPQRRSRGILISSEVEQSPPTQHTHTLLCMTESCLGMRCVCVCMHACAFHLACHPTAASSPPPFCLVGVNEQQAPSNCLCLTQVNMCQWKKQMRRKQATKCDYRSCTFRSAVTRILADEGRVNFSSRVMWAQM